MKKVIVIAGIVLMVAAALSRKLGRQGAKLAVKGSTE